MKDDIGRACYRGCKYGKVYEVFNLDGEVDGHAYSARQARRMIDSWLKETKPEKKKKVI
jgi:hypothetical protein